MKLKKKKHAKKPSLLAEKHHFITQKVQSSAQTIDTKHAALALRVL